MSPQTLSSTDGQLITGAVLDPGLFMGRVRAAQLFQLAVDPRLTEDPRKTQDDPDLAAIRRTREEVQRLFEGAKKRNVEPYCEYILGMTRGETGLTPAIVLWSKEPLKYEETSEGLGVIQVPYDAQLIAIDGETQLAARHEAAKRDAKTKSLFVPVLIAHGKDGDWARQVFHDFNTLGIRPNAALAISMDNRDPLTSVAREVEKTVPFYKGRVNHSRRQLKRRDKEVVTITALRGATVTLAEGIGGVRFGVKPVSIDPTRLPVISKVATEWLGAVAGILGPAIEDRERTVAGAPPVLAAIGAMGHELVDIADPADRQRRMGELLERLRRVRWDKGRQWEGIAGKYTPKGTFSVGGTKETAYAIYAALHDETSPGYAQIRGANAVAA